MKRLLVSAIGVLLLAGVGILADTESPATASTPSTVASTVDVSPVASGFVFEGCWAYFAAGPCYDIYRDSSGSYWICKTCGQTKKPGPRVCSPITVQTLNTGYWCS